MTGRERKMIAGGVAVGGLTLAIAYGGLPVARKWTELGRILEPKVRYVERLRERSRQQQELLDEREALTAKLGFLLGPESLPPAAPSEPPKQTGGASKGGEKAAPGKNAQPPAGNAASPPSDDSSKNAAVASKPSPAAPPPPAKEPGPPPSAADKQEKDGPPPGISLATHIERTAKAAGVNVQQIAPANPASCWKGNAGFRGAGLRISFETNVSALVKLLYALEKGDRLVRVEQAEFRRDPQKGPNINVVLHVVGYETAVR